MNSHAYATDGRHVVAGQSVYTVIQGDLRIFDRLPGRERLGPVSVVLDDICSTGWIANEVPFMSLVPVHRPFYGALFQRLHYNDDNLPIQRLEDGSWSLHPAVLTEWVSLERNMRALLSALLDCSSAVLPKYFRLWSFPKQYGYQLHYRSQRHARVIASRSRDSFIPLMAALSFMLVLMGWQEQLKGDGFDWHAIVFSNTSIHPQWLADLEMSVVGNYNTPRVGGIINFAKSEILWMLPTIRKLNMPLYLHWGHIQDRPLRVPDFLQNEGFVPSPREIEVLCLFAQSNRVRPALESSETVSATNHVTSPAATAQTFPPVERYSGQRPGEDWKAFFRRREARDALTADKETPQARERRKQKETNAAIGRVPGRKGARVYIWEDEDGFLVRRAAGRSNYETVWQQFGPKQRRYDSFRDEWDLCEEFDPTDEPVDDDDDDGDDGDDDLDSVYDTPLLPDDNPHDLPDHNEGCYSSGADLQRIHPQHSDDQDVTFTQTVDDLVYYRFGFVNPVGPVEEPPKKLKPDMVSKLLGIGWSSGGGAGPGNELSSKGEMDSLCKFFTYLKLAKTPSDIPMDLYDVMQHDADVHREHNIDVHCKTLGSTKYYIITPRPAGDLSLLLTSAAAVLEIWRHGWGPDLTDIVVQLLKRGLAFHTCIRGEHRLPPPPPAFTPHYGGLGYRLQHYKPDKHDYAAYESHLRRFLSSPRGRAARLAGGIVARLARDVVKDEEVCTGPSDSVFEDGVCLWDGNESSPAYWDDRLTADELDVICGVYRVDTGGYILKMFYIMMYSN